MRGAPVTTTSSEKVTLTAIVVPARYAPVAFGVVTDSTRGAGSTTSMAAEPDKEPGEPGGGRVAFAATPVPASVIKPGPEMACMPA